VKRPLRPYQVLDRRWNSSMLRPGIVVAEQALEVVAQELIQTLFPARPLLGARTTTLSVDR
jgi:hypothetical protein